MSAAPVAVWLDVYDDFVILYADGHDCAFSQWPNASAHLRDNGLTADEPTPENRWSICRPLPEPTPLVEGYATAEIEGGSSALVHWWTDDDGDHAEVTRPEVTA